MMDTTTLNRREVLKTLGLATVSGTFLGEAIADPTPSVPEPKALAGQENFIKPAKPMTAIILGAGVRGSVYARYAERCPDEMKVVGVAEPVAFRNEQMAQRHQIPAEHRWTSWEEAFAVPRFADTVIVATPDHLHTGPALRALEMGYAVLLEKPIAQTWKECNDILTLAQEKNAIVGVGHVLRYTPYFRKIKTLIDSGAVGDVVDIQLLEPVVFYHIAHSYVRGPWRRTGDSNPMILAKSCHDLDILRWLIGKPCRRVSSFGSLKLFRKECAPKGSTSRCTDGCAIEKECPYSALDIYVNRRYGLNRLGIEERTDESILKAIKEGPFGRCVYHCDNDVVDHQIVMMDFADSITASLTMSVAGKEGRRITVLGSHGEIVGDWDNVHTTDYRSRSTETWDVKANSVITSGHGGGDHNLMRDFVQAVTRHDTSLLTSGIEASMASHLIGFNAEQSRLSGQTVALESVL